jgi:hypothetical protein
MTRDDWGQPLEKAMSGIKLPCGHPAASTLGGEKCQWCSDKERLRFIIQAMMTHSAAIVEEAAHIHNARLMPGEPCEECLYVAAKKILKEMRA